MNTHTCNARKLITDTALMVFLIMIITAMLALYLALNLPLEDPQHHIQSPEAVQKMQPGGMRSCVRREAAGPRC